MDKLKPGTLSIIVFAGLIVVGTLLLCLPYASTSRPLGVVNALFTATSATCVTGLAVVDTGKDLSIFGQLVVLGLIQAGGLGIMTLSTVFMMFVGLRPSLRGRLVMKDAFTHGGEINLSSLLKDVILVTSAIEAAGALALFFRFLPGRSFGQAVYFSVFHSVSAFCNAGFGLLSDSLMSYRDDWVVNLTICFLIFTGGIGFMVLSEIKQKRIFHPRGWTRLSLHSKIVLTTSGILILLGTAVLLLLERNETLDGLPASSQFLGALFQSVTARTAGFNTLPIERMANESLLFIILLMFVGASSGSCGGGIKTGSFATLVILAVSRFRGLARPQMFRRSIPEDSVARSVNVFIVSVFVVIVATVAILAVETADLSIATDRSLFLKLLFEVVSAFGTVGLSMGVTASLTPWGKGILCAVMFIGRLGPLMIAISMSRDTVSKSYYAEENVMIG